MQLFGQIIRLCQIRMVLQSFFVSIITSFGRLCTRR
nr:MAG TPA: hypothetical protein [Caudoviricetes sp.]